jgi:hypothetical protein
VAQLKKSPDKTDFSDGRLLADLTRVGYLPRVWLPPAYDRDLRQLVNHRQAMVNQRRAVKLRIGAARRQHRAKPPVKMSRWIKRSEQMRRRGKPACVIVAAVANRWMRGLCHHMLPEKNLTMN